MKCYSCSDHAPLKAVNVPVCVRCFNKIFRIGNPQGETQYALRSLGSQQVVKPRRK